MEKKTVLQLTGHIQPHADAAVVDDVVVDLSVGDSSRQRSAEVAREVQRTVQLAGRYRVFGFVTCVEWRLGRQ